MTTLGVAAISAAAAVCWWAVARAMARRIAGGTAPGGEAHETAAWIAMLERRLDALAPAHR